MSSRPLQPLAKRLLRGVLLLELLGVLGAYTLYQRMDRSQDFRNTVNKRFPSVLEVYYRSNEMAGVYGTRERDHQDWSAKQD